MNYRAHVVYTPYNRNMESFSPIVFKMEFCDKQSLVKWLDDSKNLQFVVRLHAEKSGYSEVLRFLEAVYIDSDTCREVGLPDDGTTLDSVLSLLSQRWLQLMKSTGKIPIA